MRCDPQPRACHPRFHKKYYQRFSLTTAPVDAHPCRSILPFLFLHRQAHTTELSSRSLIHACIHAHEGLCVQVWVCVQCVGTDMVYKEIHALCILRTFHHTKAVTRTNQFLELLDSLLKGRYLPLVFSDFFCAVRVFPRYRISCNLMYTHALMHISAVYVARQTLCHTYAGVSSNAYTHFLEHAPT